CGTASTVARRLPPVRSLSVARAARAYFLPPPGLGEAGCGRPGMGLDGPAAGLEPGLEAEPGFSAMAVLPLRREDARPARAGAPTRRGGDSRRPVNHRGERCLAAAS